MTLTRRHDPFSPHRAARPAVPDGMVEVSLLTPAEIDADADPGNDELEHRRVLIEEFLAELADAPADAEIHRPEVEDATGARYWFTTAVDGGAPMVWVPVPIDTGDPDDDPSGDSDAGAEGAADGPDAPPATAGDADDLGAALAALDAESEPQPKPRRSRRRK